MNKLYSLLLAFTATIGVQAQNKMTYVLDATTSSATPIVEPESTMSYDLRMTHRAPLARATEYAGGFTLEDNQYIVGNSTSDEYWNFGSVPYEGETLIGAAVFKEKYEKLRNARALGIRFCLPEDWYDETGHLQTVDDIEVTKVTLHDNTIDGIIREATPRSVSKGWNYVRFKSPQELDPVGMFISYTYIQTKSATCYGMCNWPEPASGGFWTRLVNPNTGKPAWSNFSSQYGAVCIQLIVEADPLDEYDFVPTMAASAPVGVGQEGQVAVYFTSNSQKDINNFEYTLKVAGKEVTRTSTPTTPIPAGINQQVAYYITVPAIDTYGTYEATLTVNKVNGEALATPSSVSFTQDVYTRLAQRRTVVEEWTGTGCGNCPRGWTGMEYLKENYPDSFIGIAVHQYNANDPMYCNRYGGLGLAAAPSCKIDRKTQADPYYGTDNSGIHRAVEYYSSIAPAVDVTLTGIFNEDQTKVTCNANVEWLTDTGKYTIAYVLTADGLTGKGAWLQQNYYAGKDPEGGILPDMPEFAEFFSGGSKGKAAVELVYNDVLIGSSWSSTGTNGAKALGSTRHKAGDTVANNYTCAISVGDMCLKAIDYDKVYVTALVLDADGQIVNAARAKVGTLEGIDTVLAPTTATTTATYDLSGRTLTAPAKGISIVGGKKVIK